MPNKKKKKEEDLYMHPEIFPRFLIAAYDWNVFYGLLFDITGNGGLRISESLLLTPSMFDFERNVIKVPTLKRKGRPVFDILLPSKTMRIAKKLIEGSKITKEQRIFNFSRQYAWKIMKVLLHVMGGNTENSPHSLRHMQGIIASKASGGNRDIVSRRLRHSKSDTADRYVHLLMEDQKNIVEFIETSYERKENKPAARKSD